MVEQPPRFMFLVPAAMLVIALLHHPYGYYQLLRLVLLVCGGWMTLWSWENRGRGWAIPFGATTLIFNPLLPVHLDRETWALLNIGAAVLFILGAWRLGVQRTSA
jgi:hypothetical protein